MEETRLELKLPGFRFHPTEEELLDFYLKKMVSGNNACFDIIGFLNIYLYDPWNLPELSKNGEREWYFFVPRNTKHGSSAGRPNRTTKNGFWKATGLDRKILALSDSNKHLGLKKTLVFYEGRAPNGNRTDWVMSEYRLPDSCSLSKEIVLCKIYRKATSMKELEKRAAMEDVPLLPSTNSQGFELSGSSPIGSSHVASINDTMEEGMENDTARQPSLSGFILWILRVSFLSISMKLSLAQQKLYLLLSCCNNFLQAFNEAAMNLQDSASFFTENHASFFTANYASFFTGSISFFFFIARSHSISFNAQDTA